MPMMGYSTSCALSWTSIISRQPRGAPQMSKPGMRLRSYGVDLKWGLAIVLYTFIPCSPSQPVSTKM